MKATSANTPDRDAITQSCIDGSVFDSAPTKSAVTACDLELIRSWKRKVKRLLAPKKTCRKRYGGLLELERRRRKAVPKIVAAPLEAEKNGWTDKIKKSPELPLSDFDRHVSDQSQNSN